MQPAVTELVKFPFLGTKHDGDPFSYILLSIENNVATIVICNWFLNRNKLELQEAVNLFIPNPKFTFEEQLLGKVLEVSKNEQAHHVLYKIALQTESSEHSAMLPAIKILTDFVEKHSELPELLLKLLKDCLFLKKGIRIYLKHLSAYFSRISNYSRKEYVRFKTMILDDIRKRIDENCQKLESLYNRLSMDLNDIHSVYMAIDLEELREYVESEISSALFDIAFGENILDPAGENRPELRDRLRTNQYQAYIDAVKTLEGRLYFSYNYIVSIYAKAATLSFS